MTIDDLSAAANRVASSLGAESVMSHRQSATATANATSSSGTGASTDNGTQITSADFLTLLVTEMKNQDPTQPTDPNEYIQQLVGVNSLQQLIAINQDLSGLTTSAPTSNTISGPSGVI